MAEAFPLWVAATVPLACGGLLSLFVERLLRPDPGPVTRSAAAAAIHLGLWALGCCGMLAIVHRPWFAACLALAALFLLVATSNSKSRALREPFVFQDYEFFIDMMKHPRLYLPFFGIGRALFGVTAFGIMLYAGFRFEPSLLARSGNAPFWTGCALLAALGGALLWTGTRRGPALVFEPAADLRRHGLLACLWYYALAERRQIPPQNGPAVFSSNPGTSGRRLPHVLAVQSESFFDVRRLVPGIEPDLLREFDAIRDSASRSGHIEVPAWGANTVRSEFAFLSGIDNAQLGAHRFNPYRTIAMQGIPTIAGFLKRAGYRTLCVHPYDGSFYGRDRVLPALGFDEFIDIRAFAAADRSGPFVGDLAVADKVDSLLAGLGQPAFVFVITMENHGPLGMEQAAPEDLARLRESPAVAGADLAVYLRHLRNADRMIGRLRASLERAPAGGSFCWYGDHVPVLPEAYETRGFSDGRTDYFIWSTARDRGPPLRSDVKLQDLAALLLEEAGFR